MTYCPPPPRRSWRERLVIFLGMSVMSIGSFLALMAFLAGGVAICLAAMALGLV